MARPKRQEARRSELVAATQRAIVGHGPGLGLHHVAEEAGLTSGAVLYYYPNLDDLVLEANRAGMERFYEQRSRMIDQLPDSPVDRLLALISSGLPRTHSDEGVRLLCELGGSAGRHPTMAALLTTLFDRQVGLYQIVLEQGAARGIFTLTQSTLTVARNLVALEDAYGYRMIARHPVLDHDTTVELITSYARLATGHPLAPTDSATAAGPNGETAPATS